MSDRRPFRWATTGTRVLSGTLVAAGFVVAVVTGVALPWPTIAREPVSVVTVPAAQANVLACAGGLLALGRDATKASDVTVAAPQSLVVGVRTGSPAAAQTQLTTEVPGNVAAVFSAPPQAGKRTDAGAAGSSSVAAADLSGFAASACRPPLLESWLVGGSTQTGAADLVVVANPGKVASTVELTVYGTSGPVVPPGGDLVVAPNAQRVLSLAGLARGVDSPVIRVTATGAPVVATLQASLTRTLVPGGVDQVGVMTVPQPTLRIQGVTVLAAADAADSAAANDQAATVVRMLSPSADTVATVTVRPVGSTSPAMEPLTVSLPSGQPVDLDIPGLAPGEYTVTVEAQGPVVGAVWQTTGFGAGADFAWYSPAAPTADPDLIAVPPGPAAALIVANGSAQDADLALVAVDGSSSTRVTVPAGQDARLSLRPGTVYSLDTAGTPISASVTMSGTGALAGFPVWSADQAAPPITVYP